MCHRDLRCVRPSSRSTPQTPTRSSRCQIVQGSRRANFPVAPNRYCLQGSVHPGTFGYAFGELEVLVGNRRLCDAPAQQFTLGFNNDAATYGVAESTREQPRLQVGSTYTMWNTELAATTYDVHRKNVVEGRGVQAV